MIIGKAVCVFLLYRFLKRELGGSLDLRSGAGSDEVAVGGGSGAEEKFTASSGVEEAPAAASVASGSYQAGGGYQTSL